MNEVMIGGPQYEVYASESGEVAIRLGGDLRLWDSRLARRRALHLAIGADMAADQERLLDPWRYLLPGEDRIEPRLAYWLCWQIVAVACELDMVAGECDTLPGEEPEYVTILLDNGQTARIAH